MGVMTVMKEADMTETTIHLNDPNGPYFGTEIVIRQYSAAPLTFNIEFFSTAQNNAIFEANIGQLMNAFQAGNYNFRVHRIETSLKEEERERPLFHRKDKVNPKKDENL